MRFLNLSHNNISKFEAGWHYTWLRLRWLGLSHNNFSGPLETESLNFIKYDNTNFWIDLSNNNFNRVVISEEENIEQNIVKINLHHNPIICDCNAKMFESGQNKKSLKITGITLTGLEESCRKTPPKNCVTETSEEVYNLIWIIPLACFLIATIVLMAVKVTFMFKSSKTEDEKENNKIYDAFISYCHQVTILCLNINGPLLHGNIFYKLQDSDWVETVLWRRLESGEAGPGYKCCVHVRDFLPGHTIPDQIVTRIQESRWVTW